jgi:6-phosphogluconate dehydrogenase
MQLGVIGLGTMGANLARNAARNGAAVAIFNRTTEKTDAFMSEHKSEGPFVRAGTLKELTSALKPPRPILLMVKAGEAVDQMIHELLPLLTKGDIIIDAGNSHYRDTERREKMLAEKGMRFLGMGVSGGEEGALKGPSIMPGGDRSAYDVLQPLLEKMAASDGEGGRCVSYVGPGGSGHFVKMIHNGIEYALMQLIAESYDLLKSEGLSNADLAKTFSTWNAKGDLQSFLMEITASIFRAKDPEGGGDLIDLIRDTAAQKGTGKWTTAAAMDYGFCIPTINASVDARILSSALGSREGWRGAPQEITAHPVQDWASGVKAALELSSVVAYMQGFTLMGYASQEEKWNLDLAETARIWQGGCIIRSALLPVLSSAYSIDVARAKKGKTAIRNRFVGEPQRAWRTVIAQGIQRGIPLPAMSASLAFYDGMRREKLPQNLVQAQRDFFGAHTFERIDRKGSFHVDWNSAVNG